MKPRTAKWAGWTHAVLAAIVCLASVAIFAQGQGHGQAEGHGHGQGKEKKASGYYFSAHDRVQIRSWYDGHLNNLPPGLAKKDRLPPGLEKQLRVRGTLPPGLRDRIQPCPADLEHLLPPPPPDSEQVIIGGNLVLMNRRTSVVLDIFHFQL